MCHLHFAKKIILLLGNVIAWGILSSAWAYCDQGQYFGVTNENPMLSTIDVSLSPMYSSTTTSGTSGCPNWKLSFHIKKSRQQLIVSQHERILEETAQGGGLSVEALAHLMGCDPIDYAEFTQLLVEHYPVLVTQLSKPLQPEETQAFLKDLKSWLDQHPRLKHQCVDVG